MKQGYLSEHFAGVAAKILSPVEIQPRSSNQHEFNGSDGLIKLFGLAGTEKRRFSARFLYMSDEGTDVVSDAGSVTWYDARSRSSSRTGRSEHRLYFSSSEALAAARPSDLLIVTKARDDSVLVIIGKADSTVYRQLQWLFGLFPNEAEPFQARDGLESERDRVGVIASLVLAQIGVDLDLSDSSLLRGLLDTFGPHFPSTREFSNYARSTIKDVSPTENPDAALVAWLDREEVLFRTLEKHVIGQRLAQGFMKVNEPDVDEFVRFSLSVHNRRKSRAGAALENHLEEVFVRLGVAHSRGAVTERNNKPDFLFPSQHHYQDLQFPANKLSMLATKTSAKDRWRQVTKEADRILEKHLLTLEPAISDAQTTQMKDSGVRLVIPSSIHAHYTSAQTAWLLNLGDFIQLVRTKEAHL